MVEIDISKNHRKQARDLAERAGILLEEIAADLLSLEYLWDEIQCHYYEDKLYERTEDALNTGYPLKDSFEDVVRDVIMWREAVAEELDKTFGED